MGHPRAAGRVPLQGRPQRIAPGSRACLAPVRPERPARARRRTPTGPAAAGGGGSARRSGRRPRSDLDEPARSSRWRPSPGPRPRSGDRSPAGGRPRTHPRRSRRRVGRGAVRHGARRATEGVGHEPHDSAELGDPQRAAQPEVDEARQRRSRAPSSTSRTGRCGSGPTIRSAAVIADQATALATTAQPSATAPSRTTSGRLEPADPAGAGRATQHGDLGPRSDGDRQADPGQLRRGRRGATARLTLIATARTAASDRRQRVPAGVERPGQDRRSAIRTPGRATGRSGPRRSARRRARRTGRSRRAGSRSRSAGRSSGRPAAASPTGSAAARGSTRLT